ncbi:hypothetical protein SDC9_167011 [bioreactor metagenome]|uniref:Uncharacterized protein n=1 Tax=bioreactor metagenome TaxID=1076179 RepID=A0A645G1F8_9ZZZZ
MSFSVSCKPSLILANILAEKRSMESSTLTSRETDSIGVNISPARAIFKPWNPGNPSLRHKRKIVASALKAASASSDIVI